MKTTNRDECLLFVESIKTHFIENFPFLKDKDRDDFISKFDELLNEEEFLPEQIDIDDLIRRISQILVTLDNSHVGLNEKNLENFKLTRDIYCKAKTFWINEAGTPLEIISINDTPIEVLINERLHGMDHCGWL